MRVSEKQTTRRIPIGLILLVLFITVPLAEIAVFIQVGGVIGLGWTLALIVLTAVAGTWMLRLQGFAVLARGRRELEQDRVPVREVFEGLCLLLAGALLLTPGFITDGIGALLLLPPVRTVLYRELRRRLEHHIVQGATVRPGGAPPGDGGPPRDGGPRRDGGPTIEGEFEEVDQGDDGPMPPPRGGWDRGS